MTEPSRTTPEASEAPDRLHGVFSSNKTLKIGTGSTTRRVQQVSYYYVEEHDDGSLQIQPLGENYLPIGEAEPIEREDLLRDFLPEPGLYQKEVLPRLREVQKAVARGDKFRSRGETFTAEFEYAKALKIDEQNVRANFGIGLCYISRGDADKAREVFTRVVGIDAAFGNEHKHLFNEFGISLRKGKLYQEAADYYQRALELSPDDENLYYNQARALAEHGDLKNAALAVAKCVALKPDHEEGLKLMAWLKKKNAS
ncbi:MAG: tetratricopeptide repeat protein [Desulfovibrionaceae bacterium]